VAKYSKQLKHIESDDDERKLQMANTGIISSNLGEIKVEFYPEHAPKTVENFRELANRGFYDGLIFHRIVPNFVIQGGDPNTRDVNNRTRWGTGGPGWNIKAEFNKNKHSRGTLSMARSQDGRFTVLYSFERLEFPRWAIYCIWKSNIWNGYS
jgi:cyclophilin family peptidyl-prolyl cis-trans isomerase